MLQTILYPCRAYINLVSRTLGDISNPINYIFINRGVEYDMSVCLYVRLSLVTQFLTLANLLLITAHFEKAKA